MRELVDIILANKEENMNEIMTIPIEEYKRMLRNEVRLSVLKELIADEDYVSKKDICRILNIMEISDE